MAEERASFSNFEASLARIVSQTDSEKTKHDKLVSKDEVTRSRDISRKEKLTIEEIKEGMGLTVGNELKQLNTEDYERIVFGQWQLRSEDHASVFIEYLEQSRAFSDLEISNVNKELEEKSWKEVAEKLNDGKELTIDNKKDFTQFQAIRKISERKIAEEHRKNLNGFFYLNRSSLSLNSKGLDYFAQENKSVKYNVPVGNVSNENK